MRRENNRERQKGVKGVVNCLEEKLRSRFFAMWLLQGQRVVAPPYLGAQQTDL